MSGASVSVLALNGRRQIVKCTPNTTILQILEEVCKKQDLKSEEFDLKHHNKILDTTTTFRFSGLPNNAQLELVAATKTRLETEVTLAVNLENGNRLMGNFNPNETLLKVLTKICPESLEKDKSPIVIYTRREIYGQELGTVTLKSLGLTGGRAMIRVVDKKPEELKQQANVAAPLPSKPVEEKPYIRKYQPIEEPNETEQPSKLSRKDSGSETGQPPKQSRKDSGSESDSTSKVDKVQKKQNVDLIKLAREKRKSSEFTPQQLDVKKSIPEKQKKVSKIPNEQRCVCNKKEMESMECSPKCKNDCSKTEDDVKDDFVFLGARNAMLFSQETALAVPSEDLPDDFFDLTLDDARKLLRDVKRQRHEMEHNPLLTSTLRNLEESKKQLRNLNIYKKAIIRIHFPDRVVLQGTFAPIDTIKDVLEFVKDYLEDKSMEFYVYSTPPKCILEENKRLIELGFVPGALIHFGTSTQTDKSFLRRDLQNKFTSNSIASLAAAKIRHENKRTCNLQLEQEVDFDVEEDTTIVNDGASTSSGITHEYADRKINKSPENAPKWFRPL